MQGHDTAGHADACRKGRYLSQAVGACHRTDEQLATIRVADTTGVRGHLGHEHVGCRN